MAYCFERKFHLSDIKSKIKKDAIIAIFKKSEKPLLNW